MPFAYRTYQDYELGRGGKFKSPENSRSFMKSFKETFSRTDVHTHFLGLFDTVNSVATFEVPFRKKTYLPVYAPGATHIRHAVSIDERRLKFKPALFCHDDETATENTKEVWFAGNHGDVGGGWPPEKGTVKLSDIALEWMLREVDQLHHPLKFNDRRDRFLKGMEEKRANATKSYEAHDALSFDDKGWGWTQVLLWWILGSPSYPLPSPFFLSLFPLSPHSPFPLSSPLFLPPSSLLSITHRRPLLMSACAEILPIFSRLDLKDGKWVQTYWPPNWGAKRVLPSSATLHPSAIQHASSKSDNGQDPDNLKATFKQHLVENGAN